MVPPTRNLSSRLRFLETILDAGHYDDGDHYVEESTRAATTDMRGMGSRQSHLWHGQPGMRNEPGLLQPH